MNWMRCLGGAVAVVFTCWVAGAAEVVQPEAVELVPNDKCLECHGLQDTSKTNAAGQTISLFTDEALLKASVHSTNSCISCHRDLATRWEHPDDGHVVEPVNCGVCHEAQSVTMNASAHAIALREGKLASATCKDCHGHHDIVPHGQPGSPTHYTRLGETCGQCHAEAAADLAESVHGVAAARGNRRAPTCIDCHSEHAIEDLRTASPIKIAEQVCGKCHGSLRLQTRFRVRRTQADTFFDSYHGLAAQGGSTRAANCASCHGWHKILPSTDPQSTIHPDRLVETCGKCHPGIGQGFTLGKVHMDDTSDSEIGLIVNRWVRRVYLVLIVGVVGALGLHNLAAWVRKMKASYRAPGRTVLRMNASQRRQHMILLVSFIVLAVTGFALRFPDSWLSWALGTEDIRRWLHRIAGVVLMGVGLWHLVYVATTADGRKLFWDLMLRPSDWTDLKTQIRHLAGRGPRARFGRFGYPEKLEYWAVVWGTILMGVTGVMIWMKVDVTQVLPRWVIDVSITAHYYEAILACLAIVVWHFYHVIFDPDVYPANWAWLDGRVSEEWQKHEHPLESPGTSDAAAKPETGSSPKAR